MSPTMRWRRRTPPTPAPVISDIQAVQIASGVVRVSWTVNQVAQGWIEYGYDSGGPYPNETPHETSFDYSSHIQQITGVPDGDTVYFRVVAVGQSGESTTSAEQEYTTEGASVDPIEYDDYTVTTGAGWTDGSDARANIQTFIDAVPNGTDDLHRTRVIFEAGFTWTISAAILVTGRRYITFEGQGTEQFTKDADGLITACGNVGGGKIRTTSGSGTAGSGFNRTCFTTGSGSLTYRAVGLRWHAMQFEGSMPASVDRTQNMADGGVEQQHAVSVYGGDDIEFDYNNTYRLTGDGFYMAGSIGSVTGESPPGTYVDPGDVRSRNIRIHHNWFRSCGRVGIAIIKASDVTISDCLFQDMAYAALDYEPNYWHERIGNTTITRNSFIGRMNWDVTFVMYCIYITRPSSRPLGNGFYIDGTTTVTDNVFASEHGRNNNGTSPATGQTSGLPDFGRIGGSEFYKSAALVFTGNKRIARSYSGPAVGLTWWQAGGTITNNTGFGATGAFVGFGTGNSGTFNQSGNS